MKLEHLINSCIYLYPTLYRATTYEESRLLVLDHIFLHYGTGLEWHPKGFIADHIGYDKKGNSIFGTDYPIKYLPKNYFDINLWYLDIAKKDLRKIKKDLGKNFYYTRPSRKDGVEIIFEATDELAKELTQKYEIIDESVKASRELFRELAKKDMESHACRAISYWHEKAPVYHFKGFKKYVYTPGDMCHYSPLVEMLNGKTNSPHIDNFEFKKIQPDILAGAIEIAKAALNFYRNPENHKHCHHHPDNAMRYFKDDANFKKDPAKWRKDRKDEPGMTDDMTPEEWCVISWENNLKEQMGYLEGFLNKYDKEAK